MSDLHTIEISSILLNDSGTGLCLPNKAITRANLMIAIKISQVPSYLRSSELFRSLSHGDPDECILVPDDCCQMDTVVNSLASLKSMLSTIRYWGVQNLSSSLIEYLLYSPDAILPVCEQFDDDLRLAVVVNKMRSESGGTTLCKIIIAAEHGQSDILEHLILRNEGTDENTQQAFVVAAKHGHVNCLRVLHDSGIIITASTLQKACDNSCTHGHVKCLQYALALGAELDKSHLHSAIRNGHTNCMIHLHLLGMILRIEETLLAARSGHPLCLEYLLSQCEERAADICAEAAGAGSTACLAVALSTGCALDSTALAAAARCGHLECMQYIIERGVEIDTTVVEAACLGGHMNCLLYALEQRCPLSEQCMPNAASGGFVPIINLLLQCNIQLSPAVCAAAATAGQAECLTYLHEVMGCALDEQVLNAAAAGANLECLTYIQRRVGIVGTVATTAAAAGGGNVQCLTYLCDKGCPWDATAVASAAAHADPGCLEYLCDTDQQKVLTAFNPVNGVLTEPHRRILRAVLVQMSRRLDRMTANIDASCQRIDEFSAKMNAKHKFLY